MPGPGQRKLLPEPPGHLLLSGSASRWGEPRPAWVTAGQGAGVGDSGVGAAHGQTPGPAPDNGPQAADLTWLFHAFSLSFLQRRPAGRSPRPFCSEVSPGEAALPQTSGADGCWEPADTQTVHALTAGSPRLPWGLSPNSAGGKFEGRRGRAPFLSWDGGLFLGNRPAGFGQRKLMWMYVHGLLGVYTRV